MKWEQSQLEEARNYESDAAAGSHDIGFVNTYEAEGLEPPNANPTDQEPHRTCGHGSDYQQDCSQCNALCRYRDSLGDKSLVLRSQQTVPVKEEYANVEGERKRKRDCSVALAKHGGPKLTKVKTQGQMAKNFDDIDPNLRPPVDKPRLPPTPPPLPPPAPPPSDIIANDGEPSSRGEASIIISMTGGTIARHYEDNPLTKLLLSHRDSSTEKVVAKAMEDSVYDGVYKSDSDASYTRPFVTELSTASSSGDRRVLQPVNTTDPSNATMVNGMPMSEKRYKDIYNLIMKMCAVHLLPCDSCPVCKAFVNEKNRIEATRHELTKRPCTVHRDEVSSECRECLLWSAHGGDLKSREGN